MTHATQAETGAGAQAQTQDKLRKIASTRKKKHFPSSCPCACTYVELCLTCESERRNHQKTESGFCQRRRHIKNYPIPLRIANRKRFQTAVMISNALFSSARARGKRDARLSRFVSLR